MLCRTCKRLPLVCATLRRLSCPSGGPIEHQRASEGSAGAARPCRRAAPRLSPVGGPNPSPHSGRLQVSSESTPPSVRVATGPAGHRGRDQALSPAGPSPRSTQTMRWPGLSSARGPPTRPIDASSHQGPFKADRLLPDDVHRQPASRTTGAWAWAPRSCPSLALVTASRRYRLSVPQVRIRLIRQQVPSARRLFAAAAPASRRRSVASRGGAVGVLAGASRRPTSTVANASSTAAVPSRTQLRRAHVLRDCLVCRLRIQTSCSLPWAPSRRAAPRPLGGPNPSPHSCRLQVSSVPSRPTRRSMRTMRWPGLPSAAYSVPRPGDETRRRTVSSRPTASFPITLPRSPQLARRARRPRLPGTARHSLWLRLTAGTNCPFLKLEFTHQQDPSVRPSSAAAAAASGRCSVASRGAP